MKKTRKGPPNQRLKAERELRGWSQKDVADQIGADHYYLSRWERGTASPSPYYRQKLCTLFGQTAKELGLLPDDVDGSDKKVVRQTQVEPGRGSPVRVVVDPAIPPLSVVATGL